MSCFVHVRTQDQIAIVTVDNPPVNALSSSVAAELSSVLQQQTNDGDISTIVISGAGRTFIAGADINELREAIWNQGKLIDLHSLLMQVEDCPKPVIVALHGTVLGAGLELAMAGHYRLASPDTQFGQPEVNLGLIPGAEGTQRLPRLAGVDTAIRMCVTGIAVGAPEALAVGIIDEIVEGNLQEAAVHWANRLQPVLRKTRDLTRKLQNSSLGLDFASQQRPREPAARLAVEAIQAAVRLPYEQAWKEERRLFEQASQTTEAKSLTRVFFAERLASKVPGLSNHPPLDVTQVAVVGAGNMGSCIAVACANGGSSVFLAESNPSALEAAIGRIRSIYQTSVDRKKLTRQVADERIAKIVPVRSIVDCASADLFVEAIPEVLVMKQQVFADLDRVAKPSAILASNTSTLDIDSIASATSRQDRVLGLHFFNPAHTMRLIEIVRGKATSADVLTSGFALAKKLGKTGILAGNCPGFIGNRMMMPYLYEAELLVEEGASPVQVDSALEAFGMAMGPFALQDLIGLDILHSMQNRLPPHPDSRPYLRSILFQQGRLGQKNGRGWYRYTNARTKLVDPDVTKIVSSRSAARPIDDIEIVTRTVFMLINEGAKILAEGAAQRSSDIDVVYLQGYGFPRWRGGPMCHADVLGLPAVLPTLKQLTAQHGDRWAPASLIEELVATQLRFLDFDTSRAG